jgi:uncharacterized protein (UPF0332 family)
MKNLISPHILLIGNPYSAINNLQGTLSSDEINKIRVAIQKEVKLLFELGQSHFNFAKNIDHKEWRQKVSRLYYAAYNARRAVQLQDSGKYSTDVSDHKEINNLPENLENKAIYGELLKKLRDDRNLADYSHIGKATDLFNSTQDFEDQVEKFLIDCKKYLSNAGVHI